MASRIIGRDTERSVIEAYLDRPVDGLRALVIEGDAGIGKSTLWLDGVAAARERSFRVLTSRPAETERTLPNLVLGDLFGEVPPAVLDRLPAPRRRAFESALLLRERPGPPVDPRALAVAIVDLLPALADGRPLVLAIDDDQWMDPSSGLTLAFALRRSMGRPILLLLSRRIDTTPAPLPADAIDAAAVDRLRVGPLSVGAIQLLLRERLGVAFSRPTLLQLHEVSGGNPFYALELAQAKVDQKGGPALRLTVPASLERLIGARLGSLGDATRRALILIAAHGRFPIELMPALGVEPKALDQARAANVIETADGVIRFTHPLLASALYQGVADGDRREAHRRLATVVDDPVDRGRHLGLGSSEPSEDLATVLDFAASAARQRGMAIAAAELAEHGLRLTPPDAIDDRHRRAISTARAHIEAGEAGRARSIIDDLLTRIPAGRRRAEALFLRSDLEPPGMAVELLGEALEQAAGVPELQGTIHARLADEGRYTKGREWAERHARASLRLAERLNDDALRATALSILANVRFDRGDRHALGLAERAYQLAARLEDPRQVKIAGWSVGYVLLISGMYERAREWLLQQLDLWHDRDELVRSELLWHLAAVEFETGNWKSASEYADQVREIGVQYGIELPQHHLEPALIALHRGQIAVARAHSQRAMSLAMGQLLPMHQAILATCDLWSGNAAAALADFMRAEAMADARGWDEPGLRFWRAEHAEALLLLGHIDEAAGLIARWEAAAARLGRDRVLAQALRCRGQIAAARGDLRVAVELIDEAVGRHEALGEPFGRARALLALGVVRRRARQKRSAREALEAALAAFEALGAMGWAADAANELARIGGRQRIEGLSPSELRVAELVAAGHTNREIAAALFLGERTVASHLTHAYSKLGIRSRIELARRMSGQTDRIAPDSSNIPTS